MVAAQRFHRDGKGNAHADARPADSGRAQARRYVSPQTARGCAACAACRERSRAKRSRTTRPRPGATPTRRQRPVPSRVEGIVQAPEDIMRRYPRITAHIIAESLGYATPTKAALILRDAKYRQ